MFTDKLQVTLFVRDVARSADYYQRVLGFALSGYWDPQRERIVGSWEEARPAVLAEVLAGENRIVLRPAHEHPGAIAAEYTLTTADLDVLHRRVLDSGGHASSPKPSPRGRTFRLVDPDGHVWNLLQSDN